MTAAAVAATTSEPGTRTGGGRRVAPFRPPRTALAAASATTLLTGAAGLTGVLASGRVYRDVPDALSDAAGAQDLVTLVVVTPLMLVLLARASRGSAAAWVCCLGGLSFTAYNAAIYAFSVPFGPLFPVWVLLLGLAACALVTALAGLRAADVPVRSAGRRSRVAGWFLVVVAAVFAAIWLAQIGSDLVAGGPSTSASTWDVPTNPVHVLDLALFLPAVATTGVMALRRHWFGVATVAGQLVFVGLTCLPILTTSLVASSRGHLAGWGAVPPIGLVAVLSAAVLLNVLRKNAAPLPQVVPA